MQRNLRNTVVFFPVKCELPPLELLAPSTVMQALAQHLTLVVSLTSARRRFHKVGTSGGVISPRFACNYRKCGRLVVKAAAVGGEEEETRQAKEMAAAKKRWEALIREQKIKVLTPREAGYATQLTNKVLLDVRPTSERNKAWVKGSTWIPIFDLDNALDLGTVSKKITNFAMGGWWSGSPTLVYNKDFVSKVEEKFPKDTDIIIVCQKGLRSLAACEQLYKAGFQNLFWVQGGLEAAEEEDFQREGPQPFKLAGIGGVSEFFGWTDQQRAWAAKEGWGYRLVFTGRLMGLIVLVDAVYLGAQRLGPLLQEMQSH